MGRWRDATSLETGKQEELRKGRPYIRMDGDERLDAAGRGGCARSLETRTGAQRADMTASGTVAHRVDQQRRAKEDRKLRKPLVERKRRERINNCLDQLKETVVGAFGLDQSKLEKADILEMTVKHLQNIQEDHKLLKDPAAGLEAQQRFSTGYIQCVHEVHNTLLTCDWMDKTLGSRLLHHLLKSLPRSSDEFAHPRQDTPLSPGHGTLLRVDPLGGRQHQSEGPACHVAGLQERLHSSHLGVLDMWRPW